MAEELLFLAAAVDKIGDGAPHAQKEDRDGETASAPPSHAAAKEESCSGDLQAAKDRDGETARAPPSLAAAKGESCSGDLQAGAEPAAGPPQPAARARCERGHRLQQRPCTGWDYCDECGYRPGSWSGGPERIPYLVCPTCGVSICGDCSGLAEASAPMVATPEGQALRVLTELAEEALMPNRRFELAAAEGEELHAFVVGPVIRQVVSQGEEFVCGAAATAGALNACTEQLAQRKQRLQLTWQEVLFKHFQDKLKIKVRDSSGSPASWKVGKKHIREVIESFPGMQTRDLINVEEAELDRRAATWKSLVTELSKPNTAVYLHTRNRWSGHYTLIAGAVGPAQPPQKSAGFAPPSAYDPARSAVLTNQATQEPIQRVPFQKICDTIIKTKGFFRAFVVERKR